MVIPLALSLIAQLVAPVDAGVALEPDAGFARTPIPDEPAFNVPSTGAEQILLVIVDDWRSTNGTLKRMEKVGEKWMQVGQPVEVSLGDGGLGWGLGLHPLGAGEPRKVEGDGRSPAGVFRLVSAFGDAPPAVKTTMPYLLTTGHVCVDDPRAEGYNRIVKAADLKAPGGVKMDQDKFAAGILIDHNALGTLETKPKRGRGSCTFIHVWRRRGGTTDGGTAMAREDLDRLLVWLDPHKKPLLVQLPKRDLAMKRGLWGLP